MANDRNAYGHSVVNGELLFTAPTNVQKFDPTSGGGCNRKWFFRTVLHLPDPVRTFSELGKKCHEEMEHFEKTGEEVFGSITLATRRWVPPDRSRLLIEHPIGGATLALAKLRIDNVAMIGYTDLIHDGATHGEDGAIVNDPPNTVEVLDWKFGAAKKGSDKDFSKSGHELADDTQMVTYGNWVAVVAPTTEWFRLSHVYTNTKGRSESSKASILIPRDRLVRRWEYIKSVVRSMRDTARETDADKVPANTNACDAFGGCPYRDRCNASNFATVEAFFGEAASASLLDAITGTQQGVFSMGLIENLNLAPASAAVVAPVAQAPFGLAATLGLDIASQMTMIAKAPVVVAPAFTTEFANAVDAIHAKGYGFPQLGGEAAKAYSALLISRGVASVNPEAQGYAGAGDLGQVPATDMARVVSIAAELAPLPAKVQPPVGAVVTAASPIPPAAPMTTMGLLPPDAAVSKPELAAVPVEGFTMPGLPVNTTTVTAGVMVPGLIASVPPAIAAPIMAAGAPTLVPPTEQVAPADPNAPKKRGRKPGSKNKPPNTLPGAETETDTDRWLFIDCLPNVAFENLQPWVDNITVGMARHFKIDPEDLRMAPKDSTLSYGGCHGAVTAVTRKASESLAPGVYYLDTRAAGFNEDAIEGLRTAKLKNADGTDGDPVFDMITRANR